MIYVNKPKKIELIKILRQETGVSIGLCNEAIEEAVGNLEEAGKILRKKCIKVGEKFYKNPEKKILFSAINYRNIEKNHLHFVKMGCQSDFLIASDVLNNLTDNLIFHHHFGHLSHEEKLDLEEELKYQSGLVKENIQALFMKKITKKEEENFYIFSNVSTNNQSLFSGVTVLVYEEDLEPNEDQHHQLSINLHSFLKKKIINIEEEGKIVNYFHHLQKQDLEDFLASSMVTDKTKTIKDYLKEISSNIKLNQIFVL